LISKKALWDFEMKERKEARNWTVTSSRDTPSPWPHEFLISMRQREEKQATLFRK
jgi:hypothetical protein